jgi:hypothetical protein
MSEIGKHTGIKELKHKAPEAQASWAFILISEVVI